MRSCATSMASGGHISFVRSKEIWKRKTAQGSAIARTSAEVRDPACVRRRARFQGGTSSPLGTPSGLRRGYCVLIYPASTTAQPLNWQKSGCGGPIARAFPEEPSEPGYENQMVLHSRCRRTGGCTSQRLSGRRRWILSSTSQDRGNMFRSGMGRGRSLRGKHPS